MPRLRAPRLGAELGRLTIGNPSQTTTSTAGEDFPGATLTINASGKPIIIEWGCGAVSHSVAGGMVELLLFEGATYLDAAIATSSAANAKNNIAGATLLTPSAGSHTYKLQRKITTAGTGTYQTQFYPLRFRAYEVVI